MLALILFVPAPVPAAWGQDVTMLASQEAPDPAAEELAAMQRAEQFLTQGLAKIDLGQKENALVDLTLAINQKALPNREQARALYFRGTLLEELGDARHAAGDYAGALSLNPQMTEASERLSALNRMAGKPLSARSATRQSAADQTIALQSAPALRLKPLSERGVQNIGEVQIQLGAWRTENEATEKWNDIRARAGDLLQQFTPQIFGASVPGKGRYFRLRMGPMNKNTATMLCGELVARGIECLPVKPS